MLQANGRTDITVLRNSRTEIKEKKIFVTSDEDLGLDLAGGRDDPICPGENPVYISSINKVIFYGFEDPDLRNKIKDDSLFFFENANIYSLKYKYFLFLWILIMIFTGSRSDFFDLGRDDPICPVLHLFY